MSMERIPVTPVMDKRQIGTSENEVSALAAVAEVGDRAAGIRKQTGNRMIQRPVGRQRVHLQVGDARVRRVVRHAVGNFERIGSSDKDHLNRPL